MISQTSSELHMQLLHMAIEQCLLGSGSAEADLCPAFPVRKSWHVGSEVPDTPYDTASSLHASYQHSTDRSEQGSSSSVQGSSQHDSYKQGNTQHSGSQSSSSATSAASCNTVGTILPSGGLSALKLVLARPHQGCNQQQLSSILGPEPGMSPMSEPMTPSSGLAASLSAPPTPTPKATSGARKYSPAGAQSLDRSSVNSSDGALSVNMDPPAAVITSADDPNDCESTSGQSQIACAMSANSDDYAAELSISVLPPLPDVPVHGARQDADRFRTGLPTKYVHIGCAVACLCVFALLAENASAVSLTSRMFPT